MNDSAPIIPLRRAAISNVDWNTRAALVLRASRKEAKVSQQHVADHLGWSRNMIANIESGRAKLRFQDFMCIAEALGIEPQLLLKRIMQW